MATYTKPDAATIKAEAEALYNPEYQATLDTLATSDTALDTAYTREVEDINSTLVKTLEDTKLSIENSLLKRGMGRSTRAAYEITEGLADVNASANESLTGLLEDYNTSKTSLQQQRQTLASTLGQSVAAKISELNQWYDQMQLAYDQLAASTSGGGSGSGGTSTSDLASIISSYLNSGSGSTSGSYGLSNQGYSTQGYGGTSSAAKKATAARGTNVSTVAKKSAWYKNYYC
jgi:hypothetical protein